MTDYEKISIKEAERLYENAEKQFNEIKNKYKISPLIGFISKYFKQFRPVMEEEDLNTLAHSLYTLENLNYKTPAVFKQISEPTKPENTIWHKTSGLSHEIALYRQKFRIKS